MADNNFEFLNALETPAWVLNESYTAVFHNAAAKKHLPTLCINGAVENIVHSYHKNDFTLAFSLGACIPLGIVDNLDTQLAIAPFNGGWLCMANSLVSTAAVSTPLQAIGNGLRGPISTIFSYLPLLTQHIAGPEVDIYLNEINRSCYSLLRLSTNLNLLTRLSGANGKEAPLLLSAVVANICSAANTLCANLNIPLYTSITPALCANINEPLFCNILTNLLLNAYTYTRPGNEITVTLEKNGGNICLTVTDKGLGMAAAVLENATELYFTANPVDGTPPGGAFAPAGLGLAIAKAGALQNGGSFELTSTPGVGTTARLCLPLANTAIGTLSSKTVNYLDNRFSPVFIQLSELSFAAGKVSKAKPGI